LLNDFARNASVLIKQIDGAHSVIAICDDEFPMAWISDEEQRRELLAGRDCHMIFSYVRIGYPNKGNCEARKISFAANDVIGARDRALAYFAAVFSS